MKYPGRIMGLDIGEARTGVALSDAMQMIASPNTVIQVNKPEEDIKAIKKIAEDEGVVGIVAGLPYNLKGEIGPQAEKVLKFVELLKASVDLDIEMQDERMSTTVGERALIQANYSRKKRKQIIDKVAAAQILQTWLDREAYKRKAES